jgi:signal transduction histidine kinase
MPSGTDTGTGWITTRVSWLQEQARVRPLPADAALALLLGVLTAPDVVRHGGESPPAITFHVLLWVPIVFRRRAPEAVFALVAGIAFGQWLVGVQVAADAALLVALYTVAAHRSLGRALLAAAVLEFGVLLAVLKWTTGPAGLRYFILLTGMVIAALLLGAIQRSRRAYLAQLVSRAEQLERERDQQAQLATAAERTRIAREMHDIVAHSLSVIITLADGAMLTSRPDEARTAMGLVSRTGRDALADTRRVLGVLRAEPMQERQPQPGLDRLEALLSTVRATGVAVDLIFSGAIRPLSTAAQTAIYRIVQEALTNAVKHAESASHVVVLLSYAEHQLVVQISDDGAPIAPAATSRTEGTAGQGLVGIRERLALFGGSLEAGPGSVRGWRVSVTLPVDEIVDDAVDIERVSPV